MRASTLPILAALLLGAASPPPAAAAELTPERAAERDKELTAAGVQPGQLASAMTYFVKFASEKDANERERVQSCKDLAKLFHSAEGVRIMKTGLPIQHKYDPFSMAGQNMADSIARYRANGNADWACRNAYIQVYIDYINNDAASAQKAMGQADALYMIINGTVTAK